MDDGENAGTMSGFADNYVRGLLSAARNNASAYGYSVTITATFGILSVVTTVTTVLEIFAFAGGAVLAYALVDGVASGGFRYGPRDEEPIEVTALGSSVSFFSVGTALLVTLVEAQLVGGLAARGLLGHGGLPLAARPGDRPGGPRQARKLGREQARCSPF